MKYLLSIFISLLLFVSVAFAIDTTTGSSNAYVLTLSSSEFGSFPGYVDGKTYTAIANFSNTSAATLNINSKGAKDIKDTTGAALTGSEIVSGRVYDFTYTSSSGGYFVVRASAGAAVSPLSLTSSGVNFINTNTVDTADNKTIAICGGGTTDSTPVNNINRSACIWVDGNEGSLQGQIQLWAGDGANGDIDIRTVAATAGITMFTQNLARWAVDSNGVLGANATNGSNLVIQKAGTGVLVGTGNSPDSDITTAFTTYPHFLGVSNQSSGSYGIVNGSYGANAVGANIIGFKTRSTSASADANTVVQSGDQLLSFTAYGADGAAYKPSSSINFSVDTTPGTNDMPGRLDFRTSADGAASPTVKMAILNGGTTILSGATTGYVSLDSDLTGAMGNNPALIISSNGNSNDLVGIVSTGNNASGVAFDLFKTRSSGNDANTIAQVGDNIGQINFKMADGVVYRTAASIVSNVDATPGSSDVPGSLIFNVTLDGASSATQALKIGNDKKAEFAGEVTLGGATTSTGVLCIKSDTTIGQCTSAVGAGGLCTCS